MNSPVVLSGGSGFIGKRLMQALPDAVNLPHGRIDDMVDVVLAGSCIFLGAYGNMADHTEPQKMIAANLQRPARWLSVIWPNASFIYVSSSSVTLPVQTPYSRSKRAGEEMTLAMEKCVARPYSVTGRGEQPQHLIPTLIRSCLDGEPMKFAPEPTHDYIDVDDFVRGLILLLEKRATGIYEFGNGIPISNDEVKHMVETVCGRKANITETMTPRSYDTEDWFCTCDRARRLGWEPRKKLLVSIQEMVAARK